MSLSRDPKTLILRHQFADGIRILRMIQENNHNYNKTKEVENWVEIFEQTLNWILDDNMPLLLTTIKQNNSSNNIIINNKQQQRKQNKKSKKKKNKNSKKNKVNQESIKEHEFLIHEINNLVKLSKLNKNSNDSIRVQKMLFNLLKHGIYGCHLSMMVFLIKNNWIDNIDKLKFDNSGKNIIGYAIEHCSHRSDILASLIIDCNTFIDNFSDLLSSKTGSSTLRGYPELVIHQLLINRKEFVRLFIYLRHNYWSIFKESNLIQYILDYNVDILAKNLRLPGAPVINIAQPVATSVVSIDTQMNDDNDREEKDTVETIVKTIEVKIEETKEEEKKQNSAFWICEVCTLQNSNENEICEVCAVGVQPTLMLDEYGDAVTENKNDVKLNVDNVDDGTSGSNLRMKGVKDAFNSKWLDLQQKDECYELIRKCDPNIFNSSLALLLQSNNLDLLSLHDSTHRWYVEYWFGEILLSKQFSLFKQYIKSFDDISSTMIFDGIHTNIIGLFAARPPKDINYDWFNYVLSKLSKTKLTKLLNSTIMVDRKKVYYFISFRTFCFWVLFFFNFLIVYIPNTNSCYNNRLRHFSWQYFMDIQKL